MQQKLANNSSNTEIHNGDNVKEHTFIWMPSLTEYYFLSVNKIKSIKPTGVSALHKFSHQFHLFKNSCEKAQIWLARLT